MRLALLLSLSFAVAACGGETQAAPPATAHAPVANGDEVDGGAESDPNAENGGTSASGVDVSPEKAIESIKASFDAQNAHDAQAVAAFYTLDARISSPGSSDWIGREVIRNEEEKAFEELPDGKWGARRIMVKNDVAIVEWTSTGTQPPTKKKASPKRFGANGVSIMLLTPEARIREEHDLMNAPTLVAQTGSGKSKTREVVLQPSGTPDVRIATGAPDEAKNLDLAKAFNRAYEARDDKAFADLIADDIAWDDYTAPSIVNGRADVVKIFQAIVLALPDIKITCKTWAIDDMIAQECKRAATHEGVLVLGSLKVQPTHTHTTTSFIDVLQVKHGKIAKATHYADNLEMATQLGIVKSGSDGTIEPPKKKKKP